MNNPEQPPTCRKPRRISPEVSAARRERMIAMNRAPITPKESARRRAMMVALNKARRTCKCATVAMELCPVHGTSANEAKGNEQ